MANNRVTPFVRRMRVNGGTIFCFSSATEDIGLNISERNNEVAIRNFALLNIPPIRVNDGTKTLNENAFNLTEIAGAFKYEDATTKDGTVLIAESFQNYALNLEANLLNQSTYNPTLSLTVSERVFWKWLKETGAIRWTKDISSNYFIEELAVPGGYQTVVQYIGQTTTGSLRTDTFGTYNETYIQVPTSHGKTRCYFKFVADDNYFPGLIVGPKGDNILGRESYVLPHPDGLSYKAYYDIYDSSTVTVGVAESYTMNYKDPSSLVWNNGWWYTKEGINPTEKSYIIDPSSWYFDTSVYNTDLQFNGSSNTYEFRRCNIDCLNIEYNLDALKILYGDPALTFDSMAIDYSLDDQFYFNTILLYYNVYNKNSTIPLSTNLLGVLFLDSPTGNISTTIEIPLLEKIASSGNTFGNSYSFRINIKSDNIVDNTTAVIVDRATSNQTIVNDLTGVLSSLNKSLNILTQQSATINTISQQYTNIQNNESNINNQINGLQQQLNLIDDIQGSNIGSGDASVYIGTENFVLKFKSLKALNTNEDKIVIIDSSADNLVKFDLSINKYLKEASIGNSLTWTSGLLEVSGNIPSEVITEASLGSQFYWTLGLLQVNASGGGADPSALHIYGNEIAEGNKTFTGDISIYRMVSSLIPDNSTRNLGSSTNPWGSLYISSSTVYFDDKPMSVTNGQLVVNGSTMSTIAYVDNLINDVSTNINTNISTIVLNEVNPYVNDASNYAYNAYNSEQNALTYANNAYNSEQNALNYANTAAAILYATGNTFSTDASYYDSHTITNPAGDSTTVPYGKTYLKLIVTNEAGVTTDRTYNLDPSCNMFYANITVSYGNAQPILLIKQNGSTILQFNGPSSPGAYYKYVCFVKFNGQWVAVYNSASSSESPVIV